MTILTNKTSVIPVGGALVEMLDEGDAIVRMMRNGKDWEPGTRALWSTLFRDGDCVIDVGAYTGIYSIASAMMGAKVVAIEPHPANYTRLCKNAAINSVRIITHQLAASDGDGFVDLNSKHPDHVINDIASVCGDGTKTIRVKTERIDSIEVPARVGLIKIDVENYEDIVLIGAEQTIRSFHPIMIVETLSEMATREVGMILNVWGYKHEAVLDRRNHVYRFHA